MLADLILTISNQIAKAPNLSPRQSIRYSHTPLSGTKLTKHEDYKQETPTSQTVNLMGVKYGKTLALQYSDDPKSPHAKLVLLPQVENLYQCNSYINVCFYITARVETDNGRYGKRKENDY